ncbi:MAG: MoaD/ThiS family protein [Anaerolineae bacterium]|nr:MoaD/ThiS family protein [Anaerolineae bacterium]
MLVGVKLFATLRRYAPEGNELGEVFEVELPENSVIGDLIEYLNIRSGEVKVSFVNGRARSVHYLLKEGDEVGFFPPVGGG